MFERTKMFLIFVILLTVTLGENAEPYEECEYISICYFSDIKEVI